jgi:hypothetical protein
LFVSTGGIQRTFVSDVSIRGSTSNSYSLCPVRDISGDLISDFVIANPGGNDGRGTLHICSGADGALIGTVDGPEGVQPGAFGGFISNCGDWDLDGRDELLVSSPDLERNSPQLIILDLAKKKTLRTLSAVGKSNGFLDSFLTTAQCIGDMSGDGVPDIALCWAQHSESGGGKREGEVQVISGANGDLLQRMLGRQVHEYLGLGLEIIDRGPGYCHIALMSSRELLYVDIRSR